MAKYPLPNELAVIKAIQQNLGLHVAQAYDLLEFGIQLPKQKDVHSGNFPRDAVVTAMGLFAKINVTFRAIILLCEMGLDRPALALTRSMFESFMNLTFLIRQRVSLFQFNDDKAKPKTAVALHGKTLTPAFRNALFNAWSVLRDEHSVNQWPKTPGIRRHGKRVTKKLKLLDRPYVDVIGPDWVTRIQKSNTCVGLGIADFAASLGPMFRVWYRLVYAGDSKFIHQSDMTNYLALTETGDFSLRWFTTPDEVKGTLHRAATTYLGCIEEMNKRFRFGPSMGTQIKNFGASLRDW